MASGASQAAYRGKGGKRRQGFHSGYGSPGVTMMQAMAPNSASPALRSLDELREEWLRNKAQAPNTTEVSSASNSAVGEWNYGGEREKLRRPVRRWEGSKASATASNDRDSSDASIALFKMLKGQQVSRQEMLRMRPRHGARPQDIKLPTVLMLPNEDNGCRFQHSRREKAADCKVDFATQENYLEGSSVNIGRNGSEACPDPFLTAEAADALVWCLDEEQEHELPAGVEESRGFSKWFNPHSRAQSSPGGAMTAEAGASTDAGSGADDSSDDEAVDEALCSFTDVQPSMVAESAVKLIQAELLQAAQSAASRAQPDYDA